jgi:nucleoside-diphosphate-sugar epimerase
VINLAGTTKALRAEDYRTGNHVATENLVRAMGVHAARLVHVSSLSAAGPSPAGVPVDEDVEPAPLTLYGKSKLDGERAARTRSGTVIIRPPVVYGPRDTDVFRLLQAISRGFVLEIAGGERWFSGIYVKDLVTGLIAAADCEQAEGRTYFLAHERAHTWGELAATASGIMDAHPRTIRVPYAVAHAVGLAAETWSRLTRTPSIISRDKVLEARCRYWTCSPARAARELGFTASTSLHDGLAESLAWYREEGWLTY